MDISKWKRKNLLGIEELTTEEILKILEVAKFFKKSLGKNSQGKSH